MVLISFAIVNGLFLLACVMCFVLKRKDWLLYLYVVTLALTGIVTFAGTVWTPNKIVGLFCVAVVAVSGVPAGRFRQYVSILLVAVMCSVASAYVWVPNVHLITWSLQGAMLRPIVQAYNYISAVCVFVMLLDVSKRKEVSLQLTAAVFWVSCLATLVAYIHFACIKIGLPFLPIPRFAGHESEVAAFAGSKGLVLRVYGLAGEPKQLATFLVPGFLVQMFYFLQRGGAYVSGYAALIGSFATLGVIYLTYSTGAYASMVVGLAAVVWYAGRGSPEQLKRLFAFFAVCGLLALVVLAVNGEAVRNAAEDFSLRFTKRLEDEGAERLEYKTIEYMFLERPETLAFGLGPGMYTYHGFGGYHARAGVEPMTSLWVTVLADLGIVGISVVLLLVQRVISIAIWTQRRGGAKLVAAPLGGLVGSVVIGISTGQISTLLFFAGLVVTSGTIGLGNQQKLGR